MNPRRIYIPEMMANQIMRNNYMIPRNMGLFQRISNSLHTFNWNKLISGTSKTLNIMNQTIPLIKQTKPLVNNAKNMLNLLKAFKKETRNVSYEHITSNKMNITKKELKKEKFAQQPTFFV